MPHSAGVDVIALVDEWRATCGPRISVAARKLLLRMLLFVVLHTSSPYTVLVALQERLKSRSPSWW